MAQTALVKTPLKQNNYAVVAGDLTTTLVASDTVNGNSFVPTGREVLIVSNTDVSAHTFTLTSVADALGRLDTSLTNYSVPAGAIAAINLTVTQGWVAGGIVTMTSSSALLKVAVLVY
jgi:hypothetical protein